LGWCRGWVVGGGWEAHKNALERKSILKGFGGGGIVTCAGALDDIAAKFDEGLDGRVRRITGGIESFGIEPKQAEIIDRHREPVLRRAAQVVLIRRQRGDGGKIMRRACVRSGIRGVRVFRSVGVIHGRKDPGKLISGLARSVPLSNI